MKALAAGAVLLGVAGLGFVALSAMAERQETAFNGTVQRVWEDGFRLESGDRTLTVDTWALCDDRTAQYLATGDAVSVIGEFDDGEFDAFSLTDSADSQICD
jgi:hypothetical protein